MIENACPSSCPSSKAHVVTGRVKASSRRKKHRRQQTGVTAGPLHPDIPTGPSPHAGGGHPPTALAACSAAAAACPRRHPLSPPSTVVSSLVPLVPARSLVSLASLPAAPPPYLLTYYETHYSYTPSYARAVRGRRGDHVRAERCRRVRRDQAALGGVLGVHVVDFTWFLPNRATDRPRLESTVRVLARQRGLVVRSSPARDLATVLGRRPRTLGVRVLRATSSGC